MKYIAYLNQGNGWKKYKLKNYQQALEFIKDVYDLDNRCEVIIKYRDNDCDYVLCSFVNTLSTLNEMNMKLERKRK